MPSAPVLLPAYVGLSDPVLEMRTAAQAATVWLVEHRPSRVVILGAAADPDSVSRGVLAPLSMRVGRSLLCAIEFDGAVEEAPQPGPVPDLTGATLLVIADGCARRGEKAPGHLDPRAFGFDDAVEVALRSGDPAALRHLDAALGAELMADGVPTLQALGGAVGAVHTVEMTYADDPHGVMYWVVHWSCAS